MRITLDLTGIDDDDLLNVVRIAVVVQRYPDSHAAFTPGVQAVMRQLGQAIADATGAAVLADLDAAIEQILDTGGDGSPPTSDA